MGEEGGRLCGGLVHLPIAGNELFSHMETFLCARVRAVNSFRRASLHSPRQSATLELRRWWNCECSHVPLSTCIWSACPHLFVSQHSEDSLAGHEMQADCNPHTSCHAPRS